MSVDLGNHGQLDLMHKLRQVQLRILFLIETKVSGRRTEVVRRKCGFVHGIDVDAVGTRRGLSLGWKEGVSLSLRSFSKAHIDMEVEEAAKRVRWRFTGFYGSLVEQDRKESWYLLRHLKRGNNRPWLITGDFNEILFSYEKQGGRVREKRQMTAFREVLEECEINNLGFFGQWFIWEMGRLMTNNIRERLDRGVANPKWWDLFPGFRTRKGMVDCVLKNNKGILDSMLIGFCSQDFLVKLREVGLSLSSWVAKFKKFRERQTLELNVRLSYLNACEISDEVLEEITEVKLALNLEVDKEKIFWEQRARVNWLHIGDRNTSFFHRCVSNRKKMNMIRVLLNGAGTWVMDFGKVLKFATDYFKDLFSSTEIGDCDRLFESSVPCITEDLNRDLMAEFRAEEIVVAMKPNSPLKVLGRDEFPGAFVSGRQVIDNVLVAYEILHTFKKRVVYTVVINGRHGEDFQPHKGLRQGDLLSPHLFLICAEGFSRLIALAKANGRISATNVGRSNVSVSHLFFADDSMLFREASIERASNLKNVIKEYERLSGQLVNFDKSLIYFSGNIGSNIQHQVGRILGVQISNNPERYLRLPTMIGRQKKNAFVDVKERFVKLLHN
ncbi:uncharacterized protein LOC108472176 [Gossypium arboreum]|uniref:uncharacterized protein LOC108472176 n=1 Tax=Gossypium arboreum TaxID=29729 RepID=UPI00081916EE|nr:uncharacterized protein LOC108472176 [Gossypium arboreum]